MIEDDDGGYRTTKNKTYATMRDRIVKGAAARTAAGFPSRPSGFRARSGLLATSATDSIVAVLSPRENRTITVCYQFIVLVENAADKVMAAIKKDPKRYPFPVADSEFVLGLVGGVLLQETGMRCSTCSTFRCSGARRMQPTRSRSWRRCIPRAIIAEAVVKSYAYFWRMVPDQAAALTQDGNLNEEFSRQKHNAPNRAALQRPVHRLRQFAPVFRKSSPARAPRARAEHALIEVRLCGGRCTVHRPETDAPPQGTDWLAANYGPLPPAAVTLRPRVPTPLPAGRDPWVGRRWCAFVPVMRDAI